MNKKRPAIGINVPQETRPTYTLTNEGTFKDGDLTINRDGLKIQDGISSSDDIMMGVEGPGAIEAAEAASTSQARLAEFSLSDLEDLGVIGQGSSGLAKKVRNRLDNHLLVLKVIQFDVSSETIRKQVTTELRTLHGSSNRNVVKYHHAFFAEGAVTIVMEYMDGGSLADVLKQAKQGLPERFIAEIARQVVSGLIYLHKELHVVHRDIKPSNLLLNRRGDLKISDFGVSGQLTSSVSNCLSWVGTVTYMSPERIKGDSYSFDSDLWSLGLTLVESAIGRYPYPPPPPPPRPSQDGSGAVPPPPPPPSALGFWELLDFIVVEPEPSLPRDGRFSAEFCDFISLCLIKDSQLRPSILDLSRHPFLAMHADTSLKELYQA